MGPIKVVLMTNMSTLELVLVLVRECLVIQIVTGLALIQRLGKIPLSKTNISPNNVEPGNRQPKQDEPLRGFLLTLGHIE